MHDIMTSPEKLALSLRRDVLEGLEIVPVSVVSLNNFSDVAAFQDS